MSQTGSQMGSQTGSQTSSPAGSAAKTILIVDDDPDIVLALEVMLQEAGYAVTSTSDGDSLRDLASQAQDKLPDLILMDMLLSGRNGREITRELKGQEATKHIPILMLSAHPAAAREAQAAGADGFVAKPFEMDDLLGEVAEYLRAGE
ncbi:MAG TPA: response regulator [Ktedonobacterales bacterium]